MTLESNLNPNDLQPHHGSPDHSILIHAVSGLCCGIFGLLQMIQPDFFASQFVSGVTKDLKSHKLSKWLVSWRWPLPLLVILEAMAGIGLITASRKAVARLRWWAILRALLAALD